MTQADGSRERLVSVDALRGLVMVVMALDHVRDFFGPSPWVEDPTVTTPGWFMTRWITHFCAPVFVFLAGVGIGLWARRTDDLRTVRRFLVTRGLWLIAIEIVVINPLWMWSVYVTTPGISGFVQVIWVIGWSMILLAGLLSLPPRLIAGLGALIVVGHHLTDGIEIPRTTSADTRHDIWAILHVPQGVLVGKVWIQVIYPLLPWPGVLFLGHAFAGILSCEPARRDRLCRGIGLALIGSFFVLRGTNVYGDPAPWAVQERGIDATIISFLACTKYPVSLSYLLMTLGPAVLMLPTFQRLGGTTCRVLCTFGRVPFFYYVAHIALIPVAATIWGWVIGQRVGYWWPWLTPEDYTPSLFVVWIATGIIVTTLYLPCRWFARLKRERRAWWLRYL